MLELKIDFKKLSNFKSLDLYCIQILRSQPIKNRFTRSFSLNFKFIPCEHLNY
jgi:hypothetical protein